MKSIKTLAFATALLLAGTAGFTACSSDNEDVLNPNVIINEDGSKSVKSEFVVSIPRSVVSRMSAGTTQAGNTVAQFRGIDNIKLVPFRAEPTASTEKSSSVIELSYINALQQAGSLNYKVYADQIVPVETSHFMFYGKAVDNNAEEPITTQADKFKFGTLNVAGLDEFTTPGAVEFGLERINANKEAIANDAIGQALLEVLNNVAAAEGWKDATNDNLKELYEGFTKLKVCGSDYVAVVLSDLYFSAAHVDMDDPDYAVSLALRAAIEAAGTPKSKEPMALNDNLKGFPGNLGLPAGAARIKWDGGKFVDATVAEYGENQAKLTDYAYPAALWYYVSTPIKASDDIESLEYDSESRWNEVISDVYGAAGDKVTDKTQSVAMVYPAQYAVGRLELTVKLGEDGMDKFYDSKGLEMDVTKGFTLKGVLIGGQCGVSYDFTTKGNENLTIYDPTVAANTVVKTTATTTANHTLALETKTDQAVNIALELVNNGPAFHGKNGGVIPTGTTFYLAAHLDPTKGVGYEPGTLDKVFIQDHVTKVTVTIKNGKKKENPEDPDPEDPDGPGPAEPNVPDLSSPSIELGTSVDLNWQDGLIFGSHI